MAKKKITKKLHKKVADKLVTHAFPLALITLGLLMLSVMYFTRISHAATVEREKGGKLAENAFQSRDFQPPEPPPMPHGEIRNYVSSNNKLVPVLMYHHIRDYVGNDSIERGLSTQPAVFAAQLKWFKDNGFTTISLPELFSGQVAQKSVVLTFDDGYRDNYDVAYKQLAANGQKGTFFVITGWIGAGDYMTAGQLKEMSDGGMDIESHTVTHLEMDKASKATIDQQLQDSRNTLVGITGKPVEFLCYPFGHLNALAETEVRANGYKAAFTTQPFAKSNNLFEIPRVRMNPSESPASMGSAIMSYLAASDRYNWTFQ